MFYSAVYNNDVKHISVPQYDNVSVKKIRAKFFGDERVTPYLPDKEDQVYLSRGWIHDVLNTVLGAEFSDWIKARQEERNAQIMPEGPAEILMDPKMYAVFEKSTLTARKYTVGCCLGDLMINLFFLYAENKGPAPQMISVGAVRRRTKTQVKEAAQAEKLKESQLREALTENTALKE